MPQPLNLATLLCYIEMRSENPIVRLHVVKCIQQVILKDPSIVNYIIGQNTFNHFIDQESDDDCLAGGVSLYLTLLRLVYCHNFNIVSISNEIVQLFKFSLWQFAKPVVFHDGLLLVLLQLFKNPSMLTDQIIQEVLDQISNSFGTKIASVSECREFFTADSAFFLPKLITICLQSNQDEYMITASELIINQLRQEKSRHVFKNCTSELMAIVRRFCSHSSTFVVNGGLIGINRLILSDYVTTDSIRDCYSLMESHCYDETDCVRANTVLGLSYLVEFVDCCEVHKSFQLLAIECLHDSNGTCKKMALLAYHKLVETSSSLLSEEELMYLVPVVLKALNCERSWEIVKEALYLTAYLLPLSSIHYKVKHRMIRFIISHCFYNKNLYLQDIGYRNLVNYCENSDVPPELRRLLSAFFLKNIELQLAFGLSDSMIGISTMIAKEYVPQNVGCDFLKKYFLKKTDIHYSYSLRCIAAVVWRYSLSADDAMVCYNCFLQRSDPNYFCESGTFGIAMLIENHHHLLSSNILDECYQFFCEKMNDSKPMNRSYALYGLSKMFDQAIVPVPKINDAFLGDLISRLFDEAETCRWNALYCIDKLVDLVDHSSASYDLIRTHLMKVDWNHFTTQARGIPPLEKKKD